jgi:hypothetical protein
MNAAATATGPQIFDFSMSVLQIIVAVVARARQVSTALLRHPLAVVASLHQGLTRKLKSEQIKYRIRIRVLGQAWRPIHDDEIWAHHSAIDDGEMVGSQATGASAPWGD